MHPRAAMQAEMIEAVDDGAMRSFVGYNIKRAYIMVQAAAQAALTQFELRVLSFTGLSMIVDNPRITPSQLAQLLQMERSNVVALIDELEARALVTRNRLQSDRRRFALTATESGRKLREDAARAIADSEGRLMSVLDEREQAQLIRLLNRIEAEGAGRVKHPAGAESPARTNGRKT